MSKQLPKTNFHSVPVLSEDLSLGFRATPPKDIVFIPPSCTSPGAIYAIRPHVLDNPTSYFHEHWVLVVATKDVPNIREFDRWSQNWNNDPILFTLIQPYTYVDANRPQVDMPGQIVRVQVFHPNQGRLPIFDPK